MSRPLIGFAGMTHLGINSAAAALAREFQIVGYDADRSVIGDLRTGKPPVIEPDLPEVLARHAANASYTSELAELARCNIVYIAADVPTDDNATSDLSGIRMLIDSVMRTLSKDALLVVLCQVPPGFTRALPFPQDRLFYQVETLVFGQAVERATRPERFILGCADPAVPVPGPLADFLAAFECPILPMRYESAELAKISINCCLVASVSVANTLAEICENLGAVWAEIVPALKLDKRIGQHAYLSPGLGIAGGNLERDLATVIEFSDRYGTDSGVVKAWVANSRHRRDWAARTIRSVVLEANPAATIAVWGLAYKENTHSTKNSPSLATIAQLRGTAFRVHDPVVAASAAKDPNVAGMDNPVKAAEGADALMILTPWPQYRGVSPKQIAASMRGRVVLDPYSVLDATAAADAGLDIYTLGRPPMLARGGVSHA
jgi:UDPglucose 6-dehydrogenase